MRACKKLTGALALALMFCAWAEEKQLSMPQMPEMPSLPSVSSPLNMPSISTPSIGTFYVPGFKNQGKKTSQDSAGQNKDSASAATDFILSASASDNTAYDRKLAESLAEKNLLTASDITSLYDSGLFGTLSSITGSGLTGASSASTDAVLQKILNNLEELKSKQSNLSPEKQQELAAYQKDTKLFKTRDPKILRFRINGYNISDSVTSAFFSETEADGTFLFTGDRTYYADGRKRNETFYLLFKAVKSKGAAVTFDVIPSLVQDFENQSSFIYRFSNMKNLKAEKTGNLVALHSSADDLNVDLLLDVDGDR